MSFPHPLPSCLVLPDKVKTLHIHRESQELMLPILKFQPCTLRSAVLVWQSRRRVERPLRSTLNCTTHSRRVTRYAYTYSTPCTPASKLDVTSSFNVQNHFLPLPPLSRSQTLVGGAYNSVARGRVDPRVRYRPHPSPIFSHSDTSGIKYYIYLL